MSHLHLNPSFGFNVSGPPPVLLTLLSAQPVLGVTFELDDSAAYHLFPVPTFIANAGSSVPFM